jgi:hypothetical protein
MDGLTAGQQDLAHRGFQSLDALADRGGRDVQGAVGGLEGALGDRCAQRGLLGMVTAGPMMAFMLAIARIPLGVASALEFLGALTVSLWSALASRWELRPAGACTSCSPSTWVTGSPA